MIHWPSFIWEVHEKLFRGILHFGEKYFTRPWFLSRHDSGKASVTLAEWRGNETCLACFPLVSHTYRVKANTQDQTGSLPKMGWGVCWHLRTGNITTLVYGSIMWVKFIGHCFWWATLLLSFAPNQIKHTRIIILCITYEKPHLKYFPKPEWTLSSAL